MEIKPFAVEAWMNKYEEGAQYNIAETCVDSVSVDELFEIAGEDRQKFLDDFCKMRLTYGSIEGAPAFKEGICKVYKTIKPEDIVTTHGASGANHHVFYSLINPGDRVIAMMPSYQQMYSIPEAYGAEVMLIHLKEENSYLPDLDELEKLAVPGTKMICITNPNNPTGSLLSNEDLKKIARIASKIGAYVFCDETYRHLTQEEEWSDSIADIYEKGISVSSMSKVFSLAGLRLGWIATHDKYVMDSLLLHRDYNLISCGMFDEALAGVALKNADKLLKRNRAMVRENLAVLDAWVQSEKHVHYFKPKAGTTALVFYDLDIPSYEFCEKLYFETGAFVTPGDCFEVPHSMRIGYACETDVLKTGLGKISEFLKKYEK